MDQNIILNSEFLEIISGVLTEAKKPAKETEEQKKEKADAASKAAKEDASKEDEGSSKGITIKKEVPNVTHIDPKEAKERDKPASDEQLAALFGQTTKKEDKPTSKPSGNIMRSLRNRSSATSSTSEPAPAKTSKTSPEVVNLNAPSDIPEPAPAKVRTPKTTVSPKTNPTEVESKKTSTPKKASTEDKPIKFGKQGTLFKSSGKKKASTTVPEVQNTSDKEETNAPSPNQLSIDFDAKKRIQSSRKKATGKKATGKKVSTKKSDQPIEKTSKVPEVKPAGTAKPMSFKASKGGLIPSGIPQKSWGKFPVSSSGKPSSEPIPSGIGKKQAGPVEYKGKGQSYQKLSKLRKEKKGSATDRLRIVRTSSLRKGESPTKVTMPAHYDPSAKGQIVKKTLSTGYVPKAARPTEPVKPSSPNEWAEKFKGMSADEVRKELNKYHKQSKAGTAYGREPEKKRMSFKDFTKKTKDFAKKAFTKVATHLKYKDVPKIKSALGKAKSKAQDVADTASVFPKAVGQAVKETHFENKFKKGGMSPKEFAKHLAKGHVDHTVPEHQQFYSNHADEIEKHLSDLVKKKSSINEETEENPKRKKKYHHTIDTTISSNKPGTLKGQKFIERRDFEGLGHDEKESRLSAESIAKKHYKKYGYDVHGFKHVKRELHPEEKEREEQEAERISKEEADREYATWKAEQESKEQEKKEVEHKPSDKKWLGGKYEKEPTHGVHVHHSGGVEPVYVNATSREQAVNKALDIVKNSDEYKHFKNVGVSSTGVYDINRERPHSVEIHHIDKNGNKGVSNVEMHHSNAKGASRSALHHFFANNPHVEYAKVNSITPMPKESKIKKEDNTPKRGYKYNK